MRGMFGRLCHGRERRPLEPYGVLAPFVRMLAAAALFVGAASGLLAVALVVAVAPVGVVMVPVTVAAISISGVAPGLRFVAGLLYPNEVPVTAWSRDNVTR